MQRISTYIFKNENERGINKVPPGAIVIVSDFNSRGKSLQTVKVSGEGLTATSTIADFLNNDDLFQTHLPTPPQGGSQGKWLRTDGITASWEEVFSYDEATETLTINI